MGSPRAVLSLEDRLPRARSPGDVPTRAGRPSRANANKREQYCKLSLGRTWHFFAFLLLIFLLLIFCFRLLSASASVFLDAGVEPRGAAWKHAQVQLTQ